MTPSERYMNTVKKAENLPFRKKVASGYAASTVFQLQTECHRREFLRKLREEWKANPKFDVHVNDPIPETAYDADIQAALRRYRQDLKHLAQLCEKPESNDDDTRWNDTHAVSHTERLLPP